MLANERSRPTTTTAAATTIRRAKTTCRRQGGSKGRRSPTTMIDRGSPEKNISIHSTATTTRVFEAKGTLDDCCCTSPAGTRIEDLCKKCAGRGTNTRVGAKVAGRPRMEATPRTSARAQQLQLLARTKASPHRNVTRPQMLTFAVPRPH